MAIRPAGAGLGIDITSFLGDGPNFGEMGQQGILEGAKNQAASFGLSAEVANAGMGALGQIAEAEHQARGIEAAGDAAAHSSMMGGISSLAGGLSKGLGKINFGGSGTPSTKMGDFDFYSNVPSWSSPSTVFDGSGLY